MNRVTLMGNLGNDAEIHTMTNGDICARLSVATNEKWRDKQTGEMQERTEWHRVVVFGWQAKIIKEMDFHKGMPVFLEGKLTTRKWQDQEGKDRWTTEVVVAGFDSVRLLERLPKRDGGPGYDDHPYSPGGSTAQRSGHQQRDDQANLPGMPPDDLDDEIPF